ncbi:MAG: trypsin-like peptidase domain-containing protein [Parabacteroides sp.]|nr:trypsin-like peptidase domain-containing protein [Parabacteroides sp.]
MVKNLIANIGLCLLLCVSGKAQISHGGQPLPLSATKSMTDEMFIQMPEFDLAEQLRLDSLEATDLRSGYRFAYKFMTDYTPENSGVRFTLPDGTKVWRLGIRSRDALSINIMFSEYHLPEGARVFLYNSDQTEILGSFNHLNNSKLGLLPVAPIQGDEPIVEYQEPADVAFPGKLTVGEVNHGYRDFRISEPVPDQPAFGCMPAVACYQDTTTRYDDIERSVLLLIINGSIGCTGTLVNNTANDGKPYLLTASHCLNNSFSNKNPDYEEVAGNIVCYFNYNSPQCEPVEPGRTDQTMASAHFRAVNERTDMALLELLDTPPVDYQAYYAGWNAQNAGQAPYTCIHHPGGSLKRLNLVEGNVALATYKISINEFDENAHWKVSRWAKGCTAGGSSGSPLFDGNNRVIGGLTGGASVCGKPVDDYFFSIQKSWSEPKDSCRQLKCWLDPVGLDSPVCEGLDPNTIGTANEQIKAENGVILFVDKYHRTIRIDFAVPVNRASLALVSFDGRTIRQYALDGQQTTLEIGSIPAGAYIAKVVYNNKLYTQKVLF